MIIIIMDLRSVNMVGSVSTSSSESEWLGSARTKLTSNVETVPWLCQPHLVTLSGVGN